MTEPIAFTVIGAPVAKGRARSTHSGAHFTPAKTRNYENVVKTFAAAAMNGTEPIDAPVSVSVAVFIQPPKSFSKKKMARALAGVLRPGTRPDVDNYLKAVLDGMNRLVFRDDCLVVSATVAKFYSSRPRLEVVVAPLGRGS